ncbi:MAG: CAP domain-containing protein [Candidatus Pacebacteria bacterium]|nr:CAP domain-containing protein [Candidatus Paceibacterota bacterium]
MKIIHQVLIIIFTVAALALIRSDLSDVYKKGVSYLNEKIPTIFDRDDNKETNEDIVSNQNDNLEKEDILKEDEKTPGVLKVSDDFFIPEDKGSKLSSSGIINIINKERTSRGLEPLRQNSKLVFSAEKKLQDMFVKQYFEHISPEGIGIGDLASQISYEYITIGENLALGSFSENKSLVEAWMASEGHRQNILNKNYNETGVAVRSGVFEGKTVWIAVQHFGLSRDTCPSVDDVLRGIISLNEEKLKTLEEEINLRKEKIDSMALYEYLTTGEQIDKYNSIILTYNDLVAELKKQISDYNEQVREFNECISEKTKRE